MDIGILDDDGCRGREQRILQQLLPSRLRDILLQMVGEECSRRRALVPEPARRSLSRRPQPPVGGGQMVSRMLHLQQRSDAALHQWREGCRPPVHGRPHILIRKAQSLQRTRLHAVLLPRPDQALEQMPRPVHHTGCNEQGRPCGQPRSVCILEIR